MKLLSRRRLIELAGAAGAGALVGGAASAQAPSATKPPAVGPLPPRTNFVIRGAYVLSMDAAVGDFSGGDVHVLNGAIVAVGRRLSAPGATEIDGRGMIVMPGLVETHFHMWNSLARSISGNSAATGYFPTIVKWGKAMTPADM